VEVLYWQIAVAGSVVAVYLLASRSWAMGAAALWTVWTFIALAYTPLVLLQLLSAWGAFFVVDAFTKQSRELDAFRKAVAEYESDNRAAFLRAREEGKVVPLTDSDHYSYLLKQLEGAQSSVVILSGWISDKVVDETFASAIRRAVERGVDIYLGYGFEDSQGEHQVSKAARRALAGLAKVGAVSPRLRVGRFNNHQKILIVDQARVVCGSHNWLSNRVFKNREKSFIIEDHAVAQETFADVVPLITANVAAVA
jgi:phosphatidylserine/phosphatidylglycerophosphate/cardiolipin synthase-like enzyme